MNGPPNPHTDVTGALAVTCLGCGKKDRIMYYRLGGLDWVAPPTGWYEGSQEREAWCCSLSCARKASTPAARRARGIVYIDSDSIVKLQPKLYTTIPSEQREPIRFVGDPPDGGGAHDTFHVAVHNPTDKSAVVSGSIPFAGAECWPPAYLRPLAEILRDPTLPATASRPQERASVRAMANIVEQADELAALVIRAAAVFEADHPTCTSTPKSWRNRVRMYKAAERALFAACQPLSPPPKTSDFSGDVGQNSAKAEISGCVKGSAAVRGGKRVAENGSEKARKSVKGIGKGKRS